MDVEDRRSGTVDLGDVGVRATIVGLAAHRPARKTAYENVVGAIDREPKGAVVGERCQLAREFFLPGAVELGNEGVVAAAEARTIEQAGGLSGHVNIVIAIDCNSKPVGVSG